MGAGECKVRIRSPVPRSALFLSSLSSKKGNHTRAPRYPVLKYPLCISRKICRFRVAETLRMGPKDLPEGGEGVVARTPDRRGSQATCLLRVWGNDGVSNRKNGKRDPVLNAHLAHKLGHVRFHGSLFDAEVSRDLAIRSSCHEKLEHFRLACRELSQGRSCRT